MRETGKKIRSSSHLIFKPEPPTEKETGSIHHCLVHFWLKQIKFIHSGINGMHSELVSKSTEAQAVLLMKIIPAV